MAGVNVKTYEEEFLRGDQKPCWCCAHNLKTAALMVAVGIIYSHCVVTFILLTFFVIDYDDNKETFEDSKNYRLALLIGSGVSLAYVPFGFCLLIGILKNRLWMCILWFWVISIGTCLDFSMWVVDQTVQLIIFSVIFLLVRFYFLYVIWAYISVAKKQRRLQEVWQDDDDVLKPDAETIVSESITLMPTKEEVGEGDSRMTLGDIDVDDDLSHDSVLEQIKASEQQEQVTTTTTTSTTNENHHEHTKPNVEFKFKSLNE